MAVHLVLGATEMGKSSLVNQTINNFYNRVIVFDPHRSFDGEVYESPKDSDMLKIFDRHSTEQKYRIVLRPARRSSALSLFNRSVALASALGRASKMENKRIVFVIDEAGEICSPDYRSDDLKFLLTQGRHDFVDSIFITQDPYLVNPLIRRLKTRTISFFLDGASGMDEYKKTFGVEIAKRIEKLPKFHYVTKESNGLITFTNEKGKIYEKFNEK